MNILAACTFYDIDLLKLEQKLYDRIANDYNIDADNTIVQMSEEDLYFYEIPEESIDYDSCEFDEYCLEDIMENYVGKYPHYLVFASDCRWNGTNGYKLVDDIKETVYRNYKISLDFIDKGKRKAEFRESSHDIPTGSITYIVGLNEEEYDMLIDAEFEEVENFLEHID